MSLSNPIEVVVAPDLALRPVPAEVTAQWSEVSEEKPEVSDQPSGVGEDTTAAPDLASDPGPLITAPDPALTPAQQRDQDGLLDLLHCPVRRSILRARATGGSKGGQGGPGNVKGLSARTSIPQNTLSQHLNRLRTAGLVFSQRRGKEIWYEVTEGRVVCEQQGGKLLLTINARGGEVAVTLTVGGSGTNAGAP